MILLDGKSLSQQILTNLQLQITDLPAVAGHNSPITLSIILVGDDPASIKYTNLKQQTAKELGINCQLHHLPADTSQSTLLNLIQQLNSDPVVTGFFIQLPLPSHLNKDLILNSIAPNKDVDGLNLHSGFTPAVVLGIIKLLENYKVDVSGKNVVIVNDSDLIGQPLKKLLEVRGGIVTLCNDHTVDLVSITQSADILVSATGIKNLITPDHVGEGSIVVDVAGGDVDFATVKGKCSFITPTYGGIGPMTIASLFTNLVSVCDKLPYEPLAQN